MNHPREELANCISHGVGVLAALGMAAYTVLHFAHLSLHQSTSMLIFALGATLVFLASSLYHAWPEGTVKQFLLKMDFSTIFIFIAASYTAFAVRGSGVALDWPILAFIWALATAGVALKLFERRFCSKRNVIVYLLMGWLTLMAAVPLIAEMPHVAAYWLIAGGVIYSLGTLFYIASARIPFGHLGWHVFVMLGTGCHFAALVI